jgi:hypothetical protein
LFIDHFVIGRSALPAPPSLASDPMNNDSMNNDQFLQFFLLQDRHHDRVPIAAIAIAVLP